MILPTGNQSLMTFLFVVRVTRVGFPPTRWEVVFLAGTINVNYISNGSRDTLPLITRRTTSSHSPRFNNYTSDEINSASVAGVIIKICPPHHRHRYHISVRAPCTKIESLSRRHSQTTLKTYTAVVKLRIVIIKADRRNKLSH